MTSKVGVFVVVLPLLAVAHGCRTGSDKVATPVQSTGVAVSNPTIERCLSSGFEVEPVLDNGIVRSHLCVNAKAGKKCEAWAFYRGECALE